MNKRLLITLVTISILLLSESVLATDSVSLDKRIEQRLKIQAVLIQKGCDKGQITKKEEAILRKEQSKIKAMVRKLMHRKNVSVKNKKKIHSVLDKARIRIFMKRYNKIFRRK